MSKQNILKTVERDLSIGDGRLLQHSTTGASIAEPEDFVEDVETKERIEVADIRHEVAVPTQVVNRRIKHPNSCVAQTANCIKKFAVFLLSYVGLTCAVVAYCIMGGFIFVALEARNEEIVKDRALALRNQIMNRIEHHINMTLHYHIHYKSEIYNWTTAMSDEIESFQYNTCMLVTNDGWNGNIDDDAGDVKWTYAGALLYSVTVITTIGFGNITPKTTWGRVVTMLYALVGIPLTILCLTTIGRGMASFFRALYGRTLCVECRQYLIDSVRVRRTVSVDSLDKMELESIPNHKDGDPLQVTRKCETPHNQTEVPIFICLFLVIWWLVFGAIMFSIWEDWDLFTGTYFCFITLSTIGFGDIVPGFSHKAWDDQVKQIACSLYLLIGLSMLAMCFELMQIRGRTMARNIAKAIGLVRRESLFS